jgi:hypothetical protein
MVKVGTGMFTRLRKMGKVYENFVELFGRGLCGVWKEKVRLTQDR